jgi:hypothetical protein
MKLPDGMKIYVGSKKFVGEIPDDKIPDKLNTDKVKKKVKEQEAAKAKDNKKATPASTPEPDKAK